ncbi:MAG TPA: PQQ-binding-like beta-propeller repeat protein [Vicinamibacterales bacterium]|nr:PQQ-binding-like beta-propeller repeat protein [Vicinamibacterales bacterium]
MATLSGSAAAQDGAALYEQRCASCHERAAVVRAPARDVIAALPADRIVASLETGLMRVQGEALTAEQKRAIAAYLSVARPPAAAPPAASVRRCDAPPDLRLSEADWRGWGMTLANERLQRHPGFTSAQVPALKLRWAFGFDGENAAAANPTITRDAIYVGSASGRVYALGLKDGCVHWTFKADGGVRAAIAVGEGGAGLGPAAYFGDLRATIYSVDAATGELRWKKKLDDHRAARITGSPVLYGRRVIVPVSSAEEGIGAMPAYECCTFRGSVVALNAANGDEVWRTYMIPEAATPRTKNAKGTPIWGPSGAAVWSSPTIDGQTNSLYVATGDAYTLPAAPLTDAIVALDLDTGAIKWSNQVTAGDAFNMACGSTDTTNCPEKAGPDHDFGQSPILIALPNGKRAIVAGQKSGMVHAFDPDAQGRTLWSVTVGRGGELGGIEWGSATNGALMFVPLSDITFKEPTQRARGGLNGETGGGLFALRLADGTQAWMARPNACGDKASCSPALSAPAAVAADAVFAGSIDGHFRAFSTTDGRVLWDVDTARDFDTVNGLKARGGSIDVGGPAIASGVVVTTSGYGQWGGMRGNVLLVFSVDGKN